MGAIMTLREERRRSGRRRYARGGRRATDLPGHLPLVLVAGEESESRATCEAILTTLHFAVAPVSSLDTALGGVAALRPDVIVACGREVSLLHSAMSPDGPAADVPVVIVTAEMRNPDVLAEEIRRALRTARAT